MSRRKNGRRRLSLLLSLILAPLSSLPTPVMVHQVFSILCFKFSEHRICFPWFYSISPLALVHAVSFYWNIFFTVVCLSVPRPPYPLTSRRLSWLPTPPKGDSIALLVHSLSPLCLVLTEHRTQLIMNVYLLIPSVSFPQCLSNYFLNKWIKETIKNKWIKSWLEFCSLRRYWRLNLRDT